MLLTEGSQGTAALHSFPYCTSSITILATYCALPLASAALLQAILHLSSCCLTQPAVDVSLQVHPTLAQHGGNRGAALQGSSVASHSAPALLL